LVDLFFTKKKIKPLIISSYDKSRSQVRSDISDREATLFFAQR